MIYEVASPAHGHQAGEVYTSTAAVSFVCPGCITQSSPVPRPVRCVSQHCWCIVYLSRFPRPQAGEVRLQLRCQTIQWNEQHHRSPSPFRPVQRAAAGRPGTRSGRRTRSPPRPATTRRRYRAGSAAAATRATGTACTDSWSLCCRQSDWTALRSNRPPCRQCRRCPSDSPDLQRPQVSRGRRTASSYRPLRRAFP